MSHLVMGRGYLRYLLEMDAAGQSVRVKVGLCAECRHGRQVESDRGSVFWRCELSVSDASFPKYPRLPVRECRGFEMKAGNVDERDGE